jgi:hypothetical protein
VTNRERKEELFLKEILVRVKKDFHLEINLVQRRREESGQQQTNLVTRADLSQNSVIHASR